MPAPSVIGKLPAGTLDAVVFPRLGRRRAEVLVGPRSGVDVGVVDLGDGRVLVTTTDPVFVVPAYGWERSAWFAVHIVASDAATSGLPPAYMTIDLNLPLSMTGRDFETLWDAMHRECERLGIAVVSGHTGRYEGCDYPMVGGATVICVGPKDGYVTPTMARPGDKVLITKGAAIEAAGLFAVTFPEKLAAAFGRSFAAEAETLFWQMSVVDDALTAATVGLRDGGITSMHDATECGVWGGLAEVAEASGVGMAVDKDAVILQETVDRICRLFGIDPYCSISEGTLIITCRPHKVAEALARLADRAIPVTVVGEVTEAAQGVRYFQAGRPHRLVHPQVDPFWAAFGAAAAGTKP